MLKPLSTAAVIVAFLLSIHFGLKHLYVNVLLSNEYPIQRDRAYADQENVRMLLVGNSLVQLDIAPIEGTYNLASFDESYSTTYYRLRDILEEGAQPLETILMHLSLHSFRSLRPIDTQQDYWAQIIDYPDLIRTTGRPIPLMRDAVRYRIVPYTGGVTQLLDYLESRTASAGAARIAYVSRDFSQATDQFSQAANSVNQLLAVENTIDETAADYLSRIIALCAEHDLALVLVQFPITRVHHEAIRVHVDLERWQTVVDERLKGADHVEMIDFMELYFDDYSKFMDPLHLNGQSKKAFTERLLRELNDRGVFAAADSARPAS